MRNLCTLSLSMILIAAFSGCGNLVHIDSPLGEKLSKAELLEIQGRWLAKGDVLDVVPGKEAGTLLAASIQFDSETEDFQIQKFRIHPRIVGETTYFYLQGEDSFLFFRVQRDGKKKLKLFLPDPDQFREVVESGSVVGSVKNKDGDGDNFEVYLTPPKESSKDSGLYRLLASEDAKKYFEKNSANYKRIKEF